MMSPTRLGSTIAAGWLVATLACLPRGLVAQGSPVLASDWDAAAAADYLDTRQAWWLEWPVAARDHGTSCLSCHTSVPYALARPALRTELGEAGTAPSETELLAQVRRRVALWGDVDPYYPDQTFGLPKTSESRGTEAILNALVLANRDAGRGALSVETEQAFENLWDLQFSRGEATGSWAWLYFDLAPWESEGAAYFGAALAAVAVGRAPGGYAASHEIQDRLEALRTHLLHEWEARPVFDRVMLLWASAELPGLLTPAQRQAVIADLGRTQNADGGWSLSALRAWGKRVDASSDGYATGLIAYALSEAGASATDGTLARGLAWLVQNQHPSGRWPASSLNRERDPESERGLMMSDAATAFAVLALTNAGR